MIDLTPIFQAIIALIAAIIAYKVIPWLKANTTESQYAQLLAVTRTLVYAAEQIYGAGRGEEKLEYVCTLLAKQGYTVNIPAIEAMVREMTADGAEAEEVEPDEA